MATDEDFGVPHVYWEIVLHSGSSFEKIPFPMCGLPRIGEIVCLHNLPELRDRVEDAPGWNFMVTDVTWHYQTELQTMVPTVRVVYDEGKPWELRRELFEREGWQADSQPSVKSK